VATNMAGRGTDIKLGRGIAELGGLHVICGEFHDSPRVDRQLAGRCARQGDPGTFRQYASWDDDVLLAAFGRTFNPAPFQSMPRFLWPVLFRLAQGLVDRRHSAERGMLLYIEQERRKMRTSMGLNPYLDSTD